MYFCKKLSIHNITCLILFLILWQLIPGTISAAPDAPHDANADGISIGCLSCHDMSAYDQPNLIPTGDHDQIDDDHTLYNDLCWSCHNGMDAIRVETHSSLQTSTRYGNWTVECWVCHNQHLQDQVRTYGNDAYLLTGTVDGFNGSALTRTGSSWDENKFENMLLVPDITDVSVNYYIDSNTSDTLSVRGTIEEAGDTFGIAYGKFIRTPIILDYITNPSDTKTGSKPVKFFNDSGSNSFVDGDNVYDGICQICHTQTNHFRNTGEVNVNGNGYDHTSAVETTCIPCHSHESGFAHGSGGPCIECHGHDAGTNFDPDMTSPYTAGATASQGKGSVQSHSTHTESHISYTGAAYDDDKKGPGIYCDTCHNINKFPLFRSVADPDAELSLEDTDVCNACHSSGGDYDGIDDPVIGAKKIWKSGAYAATDDSTLQAGKEKWCAGCHDKSPAVINAVSAPNVIGDETESYIYGTGYGYYKTGHGLAAGEPYPYKGGLIEPPLLGGAAKPVNCDSCHDFSTAHVDGEVRTYDDSAGSDPSYYREGYRLKLVNSGTGTGASGQEPLLVPWPINTTNSANNYRLCADCHDPAPFLSDDPNTNLKTDGVNRHWFHLRNNGEGGASYGMNFNSYSPDWDGGNASRMTCLSCHNVHGSTRLAMVRDGKLIENTMQGSGGEPGLMIWYNNDDIVFYETDNAEPPDPENLPLSASTGTVWRGETSSNLCAHCHGDNNTRPEYRDPFQDVSQIPALIWTGENGYENDGANPDSGTVDDNFTFRVTYIDKNNDQPTTCQLLIDKDGDTIFEDVHIMSPANLGDDNYYDGKIYTYTRTFTKSGDSSFDYKFNFADADGTATGEPAETGGTITLTNSVPTLTWTNENFYTSAGVYPETGGDGANYEFRITYTDADNECPTTGADIQVWIDINDDNSIDGGEIHNMSPADANACSNGRVYSYATTLSHVNDGILNYRFYASDGFDAATLDYSPVTLSENQVTVLSSGNTPPVLSWAQGLGCVTEGVRPATGVSGENFDFYVTYTDAEGICPPAANDIQVWIDVEGDGYEADDRHDLTAVDSADCSSGRVYTTTLALSSIGDLNYRFHASDGTDDAIGTPVTGSGVSVIDAIVVRPSGEGGDYNTVGGGIGGSSGNDTILVYPHTDFSAATYTENITMNDGTNDRTVQSACGPDLTIISSSSGGTVFYFNNGAYRNVFDGFSITGATGGSGFYNNYEATFTVKNCKIFGNVDGVHLKTNTTATVENCEIYNNSGDGAEAETTNNSLTITDSEIYNNARGVNLSQGTHSISGSIIRNHVGTGRGKAIYADAAVVNVTGTTIKDNESTDNLGGAVYFKGTGNGIFNQCEFTGNKAVNSSSSLNITGGGAVANETNGTLTITNSVFATNQGTDGGAIYNKCLNATFTNITFADNFANNNGGALWSDRTVTVRNSVFWNNTAGNEGNTGYKSGGAGDLMTVSFSDISTHAGEIDGGDVTVSGSDNIDPAVDPFFAGSGDYHLLSNSPVIDLASETYAPDTDIDGDNRPQGAGDDMGADEYNTGPSLKWTGETNYVDDGVNPDSGPGASNFEFRIDYVDDDNDIPVIQVWIDENDNGSYEADEKYTMTETDADDDDHTGPDGKRFSRSQAVGYAGDGVIAYRFYAFDGSSEASGEPIYNKFISLTNNPPTLAWAGDVSDYLDDGVHPDNAPSSTAFIFRVKYTDIDDKPPSSIQLYIDRDKDTFYTDNADPTLDEMIDMVPENDGDNDYSDGKFFTMSLNLYGSDDNIKYRFAASDGTDTATGDPTGDKTFLVEDGANTAPILEWADTAGYDSNDGVDPDSGAGIDPVYLVGTDFSFRVKYTDPNGDAPTVIQVWIDKNDNSIYEDNLDPDLDETIDLALVTGGDGLYNNGEYFEVSQLIPLAVDGTVAYRFYARDAIAEVVTGAPVTGGTVILTDPRVVCGAAHPSAPCDNSTIQAAINASSNGDVIIVRDGTYPENINYKDVGGTQLARNVTVQSENGYESTSIIGDPDDIYAVVTLQLGTNENCVLDGFTIDNQATVTGQWTHGVQISAGAELAIKNCRIRGNATTAAGAGVYVYGSKATIINSIIGDATYKNTCSKGCGVFAAELTAELKIIDSEISYNEAIVNQGAGLCLENNDEQQTTIVNTTFSNNTAVQYGGAIYAGDSSFSISGNSKFIDNKVTGTSQNGGAINVANNAGSTVSKMEIKDSIFTGNTAVQSGGAVHVGGTATGPALAIDNCAFDNNKVDTTESYSYGGALSFVNAGYAATVYNSTFTNNSASASSSAYGGALFIRGSAVTISDADIGTVDNGNTAQSSGGAVYIDQNSVVTVSGGSIIDNTATNGNGGGLLSNTGTVTITDATINQNTATGGRGGGIYNTGSGTMNVSKTYIQGNMATYDGGGVYSNTGSMTLTNSLVSGNTIDATSGANGGGIHSNTSAIRIYNSTVAGNSARTQGGGLYSNVMSGGSVVIHNSIFWDNSATSYPEIRFNYHDPAQTVLYSDIKGGMTGTGNIGDAPVAHDPKFVLSTPATLGTPTTGGDYRICNGVDDPVAGCSGASAAIDIGGGAAELEPDPPTSDIEGDIRPSGFGHDMGAHEFAVANPNATYALTATATATGDGTGIDVSMPYNGDGDDNNTFTVRYRLAAGSWNDWVTAVSDPDTSPYTTTIPGLAAGTYEVEMTYNDDVVFGNVQQSVTGIVLGALAYDIYVCTTGGDESTIQDGITAAADGQTIGVCEGIYSENIALDGAKGITIIAEGAVANTIIQGTGSDAPVITFDHSAGTNDSTLTGFTIDNQATTGNVRRGIYISGASPAITDSIIEGNYSNNNAGAGVYINGGSPGFDNVTIQNNLSENSPAAGGGIYSISASPSFDNCLIKNNTTSNGLNPGGGGALYLDGGTATFTDSTIEGNTANNRWGGAIYISNTAALNLTKVTLRGNKAGQHGGGLYLVAGTTTTITNSFITGNAAGAGTWEDGGGIRADGTVNVHSSTIAGNDAGDGGGIFVAGGTTTVTNSILWDNSSASATDQIYGTATVSYSDVGQTGYAGSNGNINGDPRFVLSDPAGAGVARTTGDYHICYADADPFVGCSGISTPSAAIDVGGRPLDIEPDPPAEDIDSQARPQNITGLGDGDEDYDMGGDEYHP